MKISYSYRARKWLLFSLSILLLAGAPIRVHSQEKATPGGWYDDPVVSVAWNDTITFSTVSGGKRYYLGVDTVAAKAGTPEYKIKAYGEPCYATMWKAGRLWSSTGGELANKDYTRTIQSVWMAERVSQTLYLDLGDPAVAGQPYNTLILSEVGAMWHTAKDIYTTGRYIQGFMYFYTEESGVDKYRYLTYDPLYGFDRLFESRPLESQRISVWDRKIGSDLIFDITPRTITFGYGETVKNITSQAIFYDNVYRFRSRYDQMDVFAYNTTPITDQETLRDDPVYSLSGYYEWKSNPTANPTSDTVNSKIPYWVVTSIDDSDPENPIITGVWRDSAVMHVDLTHFHLEDNVWHDVISAVGESPIDNPEDNKRFLRKVSEGVAPVEGAYVNQNDWLYVHFTCKGQSYIDSAYVVRQVFHKENYTELTSSADPEDDIYSSASSTQDFDIEVKYTSGQRIIAVAGNVVSDILGTSTTLNLRERELKVVDGVNYNQLEAVALNADGTPCDWITSITFPEKDVIRATLSANETSANRLAQIRYTYRYMNIRDENDRAEITRSIWVTQKWSGAGSSDPTIYAFSNKEPIVDGLQATYEVKKTMYAIPGEGLSLPIHQDMWGYYRWYIYEGANKGRDLQHANTWKYTTGNNPKNNLASGNDFMPINNAASTTSRGRWDVKTATGFAQDHFEQWKATKVPEIEYKANEAASITKSGKVACDVSEYYDIDAEGTVGSSLTALKEPTLSYRHVIDIQPAKLRADQLAEVVGDGSGSNWLESHIVVAPAEREFKLQPQCPIADPGAEEIEEDHLQYIYYANSDVSKIGTREGLSDVDLQQNKYYARVGVKKRVDPYTRLTLITYADLMNLSTNNGADGKPVSIDNIILVNPRKSTGYVLTDEGNVRPSYMDYTLNTENKTLLKSGLESKLDDGGTYTSTFHSIRREGNNFIIKHDATNNALFDLYTFSDATWGSLNPYGENRTYNVRWWDDPTGSKRWTLGKFANRSDANLPSGFEDGELLTFYINWSSTLFSHSGYLKGESRISCKNETPTDPYFAWLIYKVEVIDTRNYQENPKWEIYNGSTWTPVAHWDYTANEGKGASVSDVSNYIMGADGSLQIGNTVLTGVGDTILYRLRTEHFQLAKFAVVTRSADEEILKNGDIIDQTAIDNDYNVLFTLPMENFPAPGTTDVKAYNYRFPWSFTELAYHFPVGEGENEVPALKRVYSGDMPGKGEYAFINKFVVPEGPNTSNPGEEFECLDGAAYGYMLCVNAGQKRTKIMDFEYDQYTCSNQQIYLVCNYCNPVQNNYDPQITADLEGWNGSTWVPVYRYKSGKIPYNRENPWYQMALPIDRDHVKGYSKFRCRAEIDGASNRNAHLLIDHLRFVERSRSFSVFQNKSTCIKDDSVYVQARIDYTADATLYQTGKLVAYQFQRWDNTANGGAGGYVPVLASNTTDGGATYTQLTDVTTPKAQIFPGYIKDGFTASESVTIPAMKTTVGNDYGYVLIPELTYNPDESDDPSKTSTERGDLLDEILGKPFMSSVPDKDARKAAFLNETSNVKTRDEVTSQSNIDFGTYSTPHIKSFVNEGTKDDPHWVIYLNTRLPIRATDNRTFRIAMTIMDNIDDKPTFTEEKCATFRVINIKQAAELQVDGATWPNYTKDEINADPSDAKTLLPANETYRASVHLNIPSPLAGHTVSNTVCKFDLLHAHDSVRDRTDDDANLAFERRYGCTRAEFQDAMETFRSNDPDNPIREQYDWRKVRPIDFAWSQSDPTTLTPRSRRKYDVINKLITDGVLELGLDYRDIYMGDKMDSYFYLMPVPASGWFTWDNASSTGADTVVQATICNDTIWLELHSKEPLAKLRFGYDSRVGDTYIVPVIRASKTDANEHLKVRIAEISTNNDANAVIIGWQATQLIETNDPAWRSANPSDAFYYQQDKTVIGSAPKDVTYYSKDNIITYTPKAGTTFPLKAGYWYRFETPYYSADKTATYSADDPLKLAGHSQFILAIAPDTVRWTPANLSGTNYWNDDNNWTPVMASTPADGFKAKVPMGNTKVIIPQVAEGQLPVVMDLVVDQKDTLEYGYKRNTCKQILFKARSQMLGQERLDYENAFVDVLFKTDNWQTFSPALKHVNSGDLYVPFDAATYNKANPATGASTDTVEFAPKAFPLGNVSGLTYNPRYYPFAFYQGFYNSTVSVAFNNTDKDGNPVAYTYSTSKNEVDWVRTNLIDTLYHPGHAAVINSYDAYNKEDREVVVCLPKPNNTYYTYGKSGGTYAAGHSYSMKNEAGGDRTASDLTKNLAYDKTTLTNEGGEGITYTLHNATESRIFFFGNPTMALVDVYQLCLDNADVLDHDGSNHQFTAYQLAEGSSYTVKPITARGQYFIAPMRAVGLVANAAHTTSKTLPITLKPGALVALTGDGMVVSHEEIKPIPRRMVGQEENETPKRLYITATNETDAGIRKAYLTLGEQADASRGFRRGEDALSLSSGKHYFNAGAFSTPISLYTIADNEALMMDIRDTLSSVPVVFSTIDAQFDINNYTLLTFSITGNWDKPLYLYDAASNDSVLIRNGLQIAVETPLNDQIRYFINGRPAQKTNDNPGITTDIEEVNSQSPITNDQSGTIIYDLLGRRVMTLNEFDLISNIQLPTGVYIVQRGNSTERMVIR